MLRVGFVFSLDASWQGGINYFKNLFNAVYQLPDRQLDLVIFCGNKNQQLLANELPKIQLIVSSAFDRYAMLWWLRKIFQRFFKKDLVLWFLLRRHKINVLSHFNEMVVSPNVPTIAWIPDFQHVHLPNFFSREELSARDHQFNFLANSSKTVILSSHNAKNDFSVFSPKNSHKAAVLQFAINPNLVTKQAISLKDLQAKYHFDGCYFFLPNQFWAHKNHQVVIDALALAVKVQPDLLVLCTGSTSDYRRPEYFEKLQGQVLALGLTQHFKVLGLVPYADLVALMQHATAVINPSYFEGWSTTVEESKLMDKTILLSNIEVHKEQNPRNAHYFAPNDSRALADHLINVSKNNSVESNISISEKQRSFTDFGLHYQSIVLNTMQA